MICVPKTWFVGALHGAAEWPSPPSPLSLWERGSILHQDALYSPLPWGEGQGVRAAQNGNVHVTTLKP